MTLLTPCVKPSTINFLCILIECRRPLWINKLVSAGSAPGGCPLATWLDELFSVFWRMCLLQVISSIFSFQSLPVFPLLFKRSPSFEFPTRLPSTSVWKNALSKQLAALWPFLQTLFQPSLPYILSSLQSCDAGFFCALCTHYLCAHSPLLIYAEVIFCHCGRFDHLTQLTPTASREKEKKQPLSSSEMGKKNKKKNIYGLSYFNWRAARCK